jgi:GAF domain-containing protein
VERLRIAAATAPTRTPALPEADVRERWCVPIRGSGEHLGYLWVLDPEHTVTDEHVPLIVQCADAAARSFLADRRHADSHTEHRAHLLHRLADLADRDTAQELIDHEGLHSATTVVVHTDDTPGGWALGDYFAAYTRIGACRQRRWSVFQPSSLRARGYCTRGGR